MALSSLSGTSEGMPVQDRANTLPTGAIALVDDSLRILMLGGTGPALYGLQPEQLQGSLLEELLPDDIYAALEPCLRRALNGEAMQCTIHHDGSDYAITATPRDDGSTQRSILVTAVTTGDSASRPAQLTTPEPAGTAPAGKKLHVNDEFFRLVLQATSDGIWDWDPATDAIAFSSRCGEMLGYTPEVMPDTFSGWLKLVCSDDHQLVETLVQDHHRNGEPFHGMIRMYHRDGSLRWILMRGFSLKNEHGNAYRIVGSHTDMTELRQQEEQRINSERRFRSLIQHSSDLTTILDQSAYVIYQNPAFAQIFDSDLDDTAGSNYAALLHPADLSAFRLHFLAVLQTQDNPLPFEARYRRSDGSEIVLESVFTNLLSDPGVRGIVINSRDISERKRAERQMRDFNALLMGIMESTGNSIYSLDCELRYTAFSSNHKRNLKKLLQADIEIGRPITDYLPEGEHSEALKREFQLALAGEHRKLDLVYGDEADPIYSEVLINPIRNERGEVTGIAVFINNTTERQLSQQKLNRAYEELDTRVRERTADLQYAMEQLNTALAREKELSELKTRFVSMVSHEFRTPLTSILSSVEVLERYHDRLSKDQQSRFFFMITESVRRMSDLLNDVILLGRAESNSMYFNPVQLNPDQYCRQLLEELQADILKDRVIDYSIQGDTREILVDPQLLRYILANLLSNAVKYSPEQEPVSLSVAVGDSSITFQVADRGIGIAPEDLKHIYEPFFRSGQVETIPGTGLGLSIVRQSVERHGGTVEVETNDKSGTTFTVRLPA